MRDSTHIGRARQQHLEARVNALVAADALPVEYGKTANACRALVALTRRTDDVAALQILFIEAAETARKQAWRRGLVVGVLGALLTFCGALGAAHLFF